MVGWNFLDSSCFPPQLVTFFFLRVYLKGLWFLWSSNFVEPKRVNCALWCRSWAKWIHVDSAHSSVWAKSAGKCTEVLSEFAVCLCTLPPAEQAQASWKVSSRGTCGINLDLQPLPPRVSPPCFPLLLFNQGKRPWLLISHSRTLHLNTLDTRAFWESVVSWGTWCVTVHI